MRHLNIVVLRGEIHHEPETRTLPAGGSMLTLELTYRPDEGPAESVPVVWPNPPTDLRLAAGAEVLVLGRVRRRYVRAGGATQSRTEVVATRIETNGEAVAMQNDITRMLTGGLT